jgi:hypothetical protein
METENPPRDELFVRNLTPAFADAGITVSLAVELDEGFRFAQRVCLDLDLRETRT